MALRVTGLLRLACFISLLVVVLLLPEVTDAETVKVSTTPVYPAIPWGQEHDAFEVLVRVEAPPAAGRRAPVDLVAVLDVSSSMNVPATPSGKSSRLDLLKRAMKFIIKKLDSGDRLAIVAFNDHIVAEYGTGLLDMSCDGRRDARRRVEELTAGGSTAFRPGLDKAAKILDERTDGKDRAGFIVLLTDGQEKSRIKWSIEGMSTEIEIHAALRKYPVHTFGFSGSHDPNALLFIAQESRGTYSFINENLARITGAFAVCLGGIKSVVAVDTRISLVASQQGGVQIQSIESSGYGSYISGDGATGEIVIGALYAGEVKNFIVRLHVPSVEISNGYLAVSNHRQQLLVTTAGHFHTATVEENGGSMSLSIQRPEALAVQQQVASPTVVNHIVRFRLVEMVAKFVQGLEKVATIDRTKADELGRALQRRWEEFKEAHKFWGGADLWRLEADVKAIVSGLRNGGGSGVAYIYSWVSSYQMQRATTMGSTEKVAAEFLTPEMDAMLNEAQKKPGPEKEPVFPPPRLEPDSESDEPEPTPPGGYDRFVNGVDFDMIDRRLQMWSKLKREVPLVFRQSEGAESRHLTAVFREASLEAINRAMHHDMYLAVVHQSSLRRCYTGRAEGEATHGHFSWEQRVDFASNADAC